MEKKKKNLSIMNVYMNGKLVKIEKVRDLA